MVNEKKKFIHWILVPVSVVLIVASVVTTASTFGDDGKDATTGISKLASKLAAKLGIDESVVDVALKEARSELIKESTEKKLSTMVADGTLTEEQAQQKIEALESRGYGRTNFPRTMFAKKSHHRNWTLDVEYLKEEMNELVEEGSLTQEQADKKMYWFQAKLKDGKTSKEHRGKGHHWSFELRGDRQWDKNHKTRDKSEGGQH